MSMTANKNSMKDANGSTSHITGRKVSMIPWGVRIPEEEANLLRDYAKHLKVTGADLLRTAWHEYAANHAVCEQMAAVKAKRRAKNGNGGN